MARMQFCIHTVLHSVPHGLSYVTYRCLYRLTLCALRPHALSHSTNHSFLQARLAQYLHGMQAALPPHLVCSEEPPQHKEAALNIII
jgi:hypothetical protein